MRRLAIVLAATFAWLALPSTTHAQVPLTASQYAALDGVYTAFLALDDGDVTSADRAAARTSCAVLDSSDALLRPLRRSCLGQLKVGQTLIDAADCVGRTSCLLHARRVRRATSELLLLTRAANSAVLAAPIVAACQRELRADMATLRYITGVRDGFALLERALRIRSEALARRAERRINALQEPDPRSIARQRQDFRAACAPPA